MSTLFLYKKGEKPTKNQFLQKDVCVNLVDKVIYGKDRSNKVIEVANFSEGGGDGAIQPPSSDAGNYIVEGSDGYQYAPIPTPVNTTQLASAWVVFDEDGFILDEYNVSGVVRDALGKWTINFKTPMLNTNYSMSFMLGFQTTTSLNQWVAKVGDLTKLTTDSVQVFTVTGNASTDSFFDPTRNMIIFHGGAVDWNGTESDLRTTDQHSSAESDTGTAWASNTTAGYNAWEAFDKSTAATSKWYGTVSYGRLRYQFKEYAKVESMRYTGSSTDAGVFTMNRQPRNFTLEASLDGVNFTVLKTVTDAPQMTVMEFSEYFNIDIPEWCKFFQINIANTWGGIVSFQEFEINYRTRLD